MGGKCSGSLGEENEGPSSREAVDGSSEVEDMLEMFGPESGAPERRPRSHFWRVWSLGKMKWDDVNVPSVFLSSEKRTRERIEREMDHCWLSVDYNNGLAFLVRYRS